MSPPVYLLVQGPHTALRIRLPSVGHLSVGTSPECEIQLRENLRGELARIAVDPEIGVTPMNGPAELRGPSGQRPVARGEIIEAQAKDRLRFDDIELIFVGASEPIPERRLWSRAHLTSVLHDNLQTSDPWSVACIESSANLARILEIASAELGETDLLGDLDGERYALILAGPEHRSQSIVQKIADALGPHGPVRHALLPAEGTDAAAVLEKARRRLRSTPQTPTPVGLREEMAALERRRIVEALETHATQSAAAKALGIPLRTFLNRLDALGIPRPRKKD